MRGRPLAANVLTQSLLPRRVPKKRVLTAGVLLALAVGADALADDRSACAELSRPVDERLAACDRAIGSGAVGGPLATLYSFRALTHFSRQDYARALADLDAAITLEPARADTFTQRGILYTRMGDLTAARADFDTVLRLDPRNPQHWTNRGFVHVRLGRYEEAVADYGEAIRRSPAGAFAHAGRGAAYRLKGDLDPALADLDRALNLDPRLARAYFHRGLIFEARGDADRALADLRRSVELDGRDPEAQEALARLDKGTTTSQGSEP